MLNKLLVVIGGPTGSGKTSVAIDLAMHYGTEIINADSRQVYEELTVGVGKPTTAQLKQVPHHLISYVSINNPYSAGHFTTDALHILYTLFARHDIVIMAGGSGLYIKSVMDGFDSMPEVPPEITDHWTKIWETGGLEPLIDALSEMDPDYLNIVDQDNHSRLIRAAAVSAYTGRPFSSFRKGEKAKRFFHTIPIALEVLRHQLYEIIDKRVVDMIQQGWLDEVKSLLAFKHFKALQTVGYKELFEVLDGNISLEQAILMIQQSTRRYAKRQLTWWRNQGEWNWVEPQNIDEMIRIIDSAKVDLSTNML